MECQPDFGTIGIDPSQLATSVQAYFVEGSYSKRLSKSQLTIVSDAVPMPLSFANVQEALEHGTRFFDAVYYFSFPLAQRPAIIAAGQGSLPEKRDLHTVAKALFFQTFMVLIRGSPSMDKSKTTGSVVPGFLAGTMGLRESPAYYANLLASFTLEHVDWRFIRNLSFIGSSQEFINRSQLGMAGYRMLQPFLYYDVIEGASQSIIDAVAVMKKLASSPPDWSIHSTTRSPECIVYYGSLNKNAHDLLLHAFSREDVRLMVANKMIFAEGMIDPRYAKWKSWTISTMPKLENPIFTPINSSRGSGASTS